MPTKRVTPSKDVEASPRRTMRFVATKSEAQLSLPSLHLFRSWLVGYPTRLINRAHGSLLEIGFAIPHFAEWRPKILKDIDIGLGHVATDDGHSGRVEEAGGEALQRESRVGGDHGRAGLRNGATQRLGWGRYRGRVRPEASSAWQALAGGSIAPSGRRSCAAPPRA